MKKHKAFVRVSVSASELLPSRSVDYNQQVRLLMRNLFLVLCCCFGLTLRGAEDRIWADGTINGHRVRLGFDTAASDPILFRSTAERLKLKIIDPSADFQPPPGQVAAGYTEPCDFAFGTLQARGKFRVVDFPPELSSKAEGVLSWSLFRDKILSIDAGRQRVQIGDDLRENVVGWQKFRLRIDTRSLGFKVADEDARQNSVYVDTGSEGGVALHPSFWKEWAAKHTNQPATLTATFTPAVGLTVHRELWASQISIGSLVLKDVPVSSEDEAHTLTVMPDHAATLGVFALRRMDLVVDGKNGVVYAHPRAEEVPPYAHNRLGAVFVPRNMQSDPLLAHVAPGSPAHLAGIRDNDVLLKVDDLEVTKWRTDPQVMPLSRFWERPAGTALRLTIKRGEREYQTSVVLKEILGSRVSQPKK